MEIISDLNQAREIFGPCPLLRSCKIIWLIPKMTQGQVSPPKSIRDKRIKSVKLVYSRLTVVLKLWTFLLNEVVGYERYIQNE